MNILPPLESVKGITARKQYDLLPLSCEILSGFITPPSRRCASSKMCLRTAICSNPRRRTTAGAAARFWALTPNSRPRASTAK